MSTPLQLAAERDPSGLFYCLELNTPDGEVATWAATNVGSRTGKPYFSKVTNWGDIPRAALDRTYTLESPQYTVEVDDTDRRLAVMMSGRYAEEIYDSTVTVYVGHREVEFADWQIRTSGVLDKLTPVGTRCTLSFRFDDRTLRREVGRYLLTKGGWPNIHPREVGKMAPIRIGYFRSAGNTDEGAVECPCVDTVSKYFYYSLGRKDVYAAYVDDVSVGASFTVRYLTVEGREHTIIDLGVVAMTAVVTADGQGPITGDTSHRDNPVSALAYLLTNHAYATFKNEATANATPTNSVFDATLLAAAEQQADDWGYELYSGIDVSDKKETWLSVINKWAATWQARVYWTAEGKLGIKFENNQEPEESVPVWNFSRAEVNQPMKSSDEDSATDSISLDFNGGQSITVTEDATQDPKIPTSLSLPYMWSSQISVAGLNAARLVARHVGSRKLRILRRGRRLVTQEVPLSYVLISDLVTEVDIVHRLGVSVSADGWTVTAPRRARVLKILEKPNTMTAVVTLEDLRANHTQVDMWDTALVYSPTDESNGLVSLGYEGNALANINQGNSSNTGEELATFLNSGELLANVLYGATAWIGDRRGTLFWNGLRNNIVPQSTFINGTTGWGGSSGHAVDTTDLLFPSSVSANSMKLTQAAGVQPILGTGAGALPATNDKYFLSVDAKSDANTNGWEFSLNYTGSGATPYYWNGTGWTATTEQWVPLLDPDTGTQAVVAGKKTRLWPANWIDFTLRADTANCRLRVRYKSTANTQSGHVYHVQLEKIDAGNGKYATGRLITSGSTVLRGAAAPFTFTWRQKTLRGFTLAFDVQTVWDAANRPSIDPFFWYGSITKSGQTDEVWVTYNTTLQRYEASKKVAGVTYTAYKSYVVARDVKHRVRVRFVSPDGENDLAANLISIWVEDDKGTDASAAALRNIDDVTATLVGEIGGRTLSVTYPSTNAVDGGMSQIIMIRGGLPDEEVLRL